MFRRKLLLLFGLMATLTGAYAYDGTLAIANVRNAVPGYTGSFDVVLNGSDKTYVAMQFDLTLPSGLTLVTPLTDCYAAGELVNGHTFTVSDQGSGKYRFACYANPTAPFTAGNGTLLTLYYAVAPGTSAGDKTATLSDVTFSYNYVSYHPSAGDNTITIGSDLALSEDETTAPAASSGTVNVTVGRTLKGGKWNTIVLPFAMTNDQLKTAFGNDVKLASYEGYTKSGENISVNFVTSTELAPHTPYIIKVSDDKTSFSATGVSITTATNNLTVNKGTAEAPKSIIGTYVAETTIPDKGLFLLDDEFRYSMGASKLKAFRAYFSFADFDYSGVSAARVLYDVFDMSTGIHSINGTSRPDGNVYNLNGQRVDGAARGVLIKNDKKVFNK